MTVYVSLAHVAGGQTFGQAHGTCDPSLVGRTMGAGHLHGGGPHGVLQAAWHAQQGFFLHLIDLHQIESGPRAFGAHFLFFRKA
ncbi:MAG: hypothetical protein IPJ06_05655 [Saprospiraceae bacterium]|nr:hypothetical protein [Saprospiraceae bacterium]